MKVNRKVLLLDVFDLISFIVFVGGIVLFVRFFLVNPFTIVGQSMEPTFHDKEFILIDRITPRVGSFHRGDVIVFVPGQKDVPYIKRVIGVPGDIVKLKDGDVYVCKENTEDKNCTKLAEPYLRPGTVTNADCKKTEFIVQPDTLFVLGDNRTHSTDSRCCFGLGCYTGTSYLVSQQEIVGKVVVRLYPFSLF